MMEGRKKKWILICVKVMIWGCGWGAAIMWARRFAPYIPAAALASGCSLTSLIIRGVFRQSEIGRYFDDVEKYKRMKNRWRKAEVLFYVIVALNCISVFPLLETEYCKSLSAAEENGIDYAVYQEKQSAVFILGISAAQLACGLKIAALVIDKD